MDVVIRKAKLQGTVSVCASKSEAHRLLICAFLSFTKTRVILGSGTMSEDILATANCLSALGAEVRMEADAILIDSVGCAGGSSSRIVLDCGESGSTLRFMLPIAVALGGEYLFTGRGRLPERPNRPLLEAMAAGGAVFDREDGLPLLACGKLKPGSYEIPGNVSSQYISGLLFALPLLHGDSTIKITGKIESLPYIYITLSVLERFGVTASLHIEKQEENDVPFGGEIFVPGGQRFCSPGDVKVNGDWSNGAFWLCAGAIGENKIVCTNLEMQTAQGDAKITKIIDAILRAERGTDVVIDASQTPDLVPVTAVLACSRTGRTVICGAERLRIKESDRIKTTAVLISALGGAAEERVDGLLIIGNGRLRGGTVDSFGDHRIAMSAAVAASLCTEPVVIKNAHAANKSYPDFFEEYERLGGVIERS